MIPLHDRLRHVGCQSSRRPNTGSGRKNLYTPPAITACEVQIALSLTLHYALNGKNVPRFVCLARFISGSSRNDYEALSIPHPMLQNLCRTPVEYPVGNASFAGNSR